MAEDVYDQIVRLISAEAVRMTQDGRSNGLGPGACAAAVISTVLFSLADGYGPEAESVIDTIAASAKQTIRDKLATENARQQH